MRMTKRQRRIAKAKRKWWIWGEDYQATKALMENCISTYLVEELNAHGLHTVASPDGKLYHIRVVATLVRA